MTAAVKAILANYESDNPGVKANLYRILMQGRLGGTGKLVILPVDQGFEHGPARSFAVNPPAYDPHYHYQIAIDAGLSAYAAPLGMLEAGADTFAGQIPTILKCNSSNSWAASANQALTGGVEDALRLGCAAIGFTIYPGSDDVIDMIEEIKDLSAEAKSVGIPTVLWSYPRGGSLPKSGELALDVGAYAAHMAALMGAHIIKVKLPSDHIEQPDAKKAYAGTDWSQQSDRVRHVVQSCFNGRRIVVFSGGAAKGADAVYQDAIDIRDGGGNGSIIGRNTFQRERGEALAMLDRLVSIYQARNKRVVERTQPVDPGWAAVDEYIAEQLIRDDPVAALAANAAAGLPEIDVSAAQGRMLHLFARMSGARRILEIGTLGGYSTIWLARALPADGRLVSLELDPHHAAVARDNLAREALADRVEVIVGPAADSLAGMTADAPFDLVFIDADKQGNVTYLREAIRLARSGATIIVDNVVREGGVLDAESSDERIIGTRKLFDAAGAEPRLSATAVQTVGAKKWDGFLIAILD